MQRMGRASSRGRRGLLWDLHAPVVARADDEHLGRVREHGLQVLHGEGVSLPAPPALLDVVREEDDVGVVVAAADADSAEAIVVDLHELMVFILPGVSGF